MRKDFNKWMILTVTVLTFMGCEKDETRTVLNVGAQPTLSSNATTLVLQQADANNNAVTFTWTAASFGFDAAITYALQISKAGTSFASATTTEVALSSTAFTRTFKVIELNRELLKVVLYGSPQQVEVRVKATVAAAAPPVYSNVVNLTATPYRDLITYSYPSALNVAGNFQGWNPATGPQIVNVGNGGYNGHEGYIYFNDPNPAFKLVKGDNWGGGDYGSAGAGTLGNGGPNLTLPDGAGIYRIRAHIPSLTWSYVKITGWGLIGSATPGGWGSDQDMNYNATTGVYSITLDLVAGDIKFRANDGWGINLGDNGGDFKPEYDGANISITTAGNYSISLDISVGGNYAYTVKKN